MDSGADSNASVPSDLRVIVYRIVKFVAIVLAVAISIKFFVFDTVPIATDQMSPTLVDGDRALVFKTLCIPPFSAWLAPLRGSPVVFRNPLLGNKPSCLRVAAVSGDSILITRGACLILNRRAVARSSRPDAPDILPPEFSPRDSMPLYVLPEIGASVNLDSLSQRDFFFAASLIRQEHPGKQFDVRPSLSIDGVASDTLRLKDFALYKGRLDSVSEQNKFDWFFWNRVRDYLESSQTGKDVILSFSLFRSGAKISGYTFSRSCIFLVADDWQKGFDSRFFGPVLATAVQGRVVGVLWSIGPEGNARATLRADRLFKIIR